MSCHRQSPKSAAAIWNDIYREGCITEGDDAGSMSARRGWKE